MFKIYLFISLDVKGLRQSRKGWVITSLALTNTVLDCHKYYPTNLLWTVTQLINKEEENLSEIINTFSQKYFSSVLCSLLVVS